MDPIKTKEKFYGWRVVIIAALVLTFVGNFYSNATTVANGLMMASPTNTISQVTYGLGWTVNSIFGAILALILGVLVDKFGAKGIFRIGAICGILAGLVLVRFQENSGIMYLINYGVVCCIAYNCCSFVPNQTVINSWMIRRRGTASSIVNTGTVIAGVITPPLVTWIISSLGGGKWQYGYYFFGATSIIGLILTFWLISKPSDVGQYPDGIAPGDIVEEQTIENSKKSIVSTVFKNANIENHFSLKSAVKTPLFWVITFAYILILVLSGYMMNPGSVIFLKAGFTMPVISTVLSIRQVIRLIFLFFLMRYMDRIEPLKLMAACCVLTAIGYFISANPTHYWQIVVFYGVGSIIMSAQLAIPGVMLANIFGNTNLGKIFGLCLALANLLSSPASTISGVIAENTGTYALANYIYSGVAIAAALLCVVALLLMNKTKQKIQSI